MALFNDRVVLKVRRGQIPQDAVGAALDAGGSLTKVAFIRKPEHDDAQGDVEVELAYFHNHNFGDALKHVVAHGLVNAAPDRLLPATGATTTRNHDLIKNTIGLSAATFNEFTCHVKGITFLVRNFAQDDFCDPESDYQIESLVAETEGLSLNSDLQKARNETFCFKEERKMVQSFAEDAEGRFPFLMVMAGSGNGNFIVDAANDMVMISGTFKAGKSLLGLTGTIFDIRENHYVELCAMAEKGRTSATHKTSAATSAGDTYDQINQSVQKEFPFSGVDDSKESIALALVKDFAAEQAYTIAVSVSKTNVKNVYYGGGMAMSKVMRREIMAAVMRYKLAGVKLRFLKTNCTGALGALVFQRELHEEAAKLAEMLSAAKATQAQ